MSKITQLLRLSSFKRANKETKTGKRAWNWCSPFHHVFKSLEQLLENWSLHWNHSNLLSLFVSPTGLLCTFKSIYSIVIKINLLKWRVKHPNLSNPTPVMKPFRRQRRYNLKLPLSIKNLSESLSTRGMHKNTILARIYAYNTLNVVKILFKNMIATERSDHVTNHLSQNKVCFNESLKPKRPCTILPQNHRLSRALKLLSSLISSFTAA